MDEDRRRGGVGLARPPARARRERQHVGDIVVAVARDEGRPIAFPAERGVAVVGGGEGWP